MKPLDFVKTPRGGFAMITETHDGRASIDFIGSGYLYEKNAWWDESEVEVIDNLPHLLGRIACHPFGRGQADVDRIFKEDL